MYNEDETDDESYLSEDDDNKYYEPEEQSTTKYNIVLCELYNERVHGISSNEIVKYNYLTINRYKTFDNVIYNDAKYLNSIYNNRLNKKHAIYRNYKNIISNKNYIKPEIAECIYLPNTHECIAILKTFWIRLIQRIWKNIYKKRTSIIKKRCHFNSLKYREIYGKWPDDCIKYPVLKGILSFLNQ